MKRSAFASFLFSTLLLAAVAISGNTLLRATVQPAAFTEGSFLSPQQVTAKGIMPESLTGGRNLQVTTGNLGAANGSGVFGAPSLFTLSANGNLPIAAKGVLCGAYPRLHLRINVLRI